MFKRLANWLNHFDTITIDGLEWPLQTRRQQLLARLRRVREGLRHPCWSRWRAPWWPGC